MFVILYRFYDLDLKITMIFLVFHLLDFAICPLFRIVTYYLQLEYSTLKTTSLNFVSLFLRFILSFLNTPFCTIIAQNADTVCKILCMQILFHINFKVDKNGNVIKSS